MKRRQFLKRTVAGAAMAVAGGGALCGSGPLGRRRVPAGKALGLLLGELRSSDPEVAAESARLLGELAIPEAVEPLLAFVESSRFYSKTAGLHALMQTGEPGACGRILPLIENPGVYDDYYWFGARAVRFSAALAVLGLDAALEPGYIDRVFESKDWADILCPIYSGTILELPAKGEKVLRLRQRTADMICEEPCAKPEVLAMCCRGLAKMEDPRASGPLLRLVRHSSRFVRAEAVWALLGLPSGRDHAGVAEELCHSDPASHVRRKAAAALYMNGEKGGIAVVLEGLSGASEPDPFFRSASVEMAGLAGMREARGPVARALSDPHPCVRSSAVEALERLDHEGGMAPVRRMLEDGDVRVRLQAAKYLLSPGPGRGGQGTPRRRESTT